MFTTDTGILRRAINMLEQGCRAMMAAPPGMFDWGLFGAPECRTPGCCWGFTQPFFHGFAACVGKKSWETSKSNLDAWAEELGLTMHWGTVVFWSIPKEFYGTDGTAGLYNTPAANRIYKMRVDANNRDRHRANHLMKLLIDRLRHRLAVCEVEAGEWGRAKPARDMPVGRERERRVAEMVGAA